MSYSLENKTDITNDSDNTMTPAEYGKMKRNREESKRKSNRISSVGITIGTLTSRGGQFPKRAKVLLPDLGFRL